MTILGIDLGSSAIRLAGLAGRTLAPWRMEGGGNGSPTTVVFDETGSLGAGPAAVRRAAIQPQHAVRCPKRLLALGASHPWIRAHARLTGQTVVASAEGSVEILAEGVPLRPGRMISAGLQHALQVLEVEHLPALDSDVVVAAFPAWIDERARRVLQTAIRNAGVPLDSLLDEVSATALRLASRPGSSADAAMIVDVGAGGMTVGIFSISPEAVIRRAICATADVAGEDVDAMLLERAIAQFGAVPASVLAQPAALEMIRNASEQAKRDLAESETVQLNAPLPGLFVPVALTRDDLAFASQPLLHRLEGLIAQALERAAMRAASLETVWVGGGSGRLAEVLARVESLTGRKPVPVPGADVAVALGCAYRAGAKAGQLPVVRLEDGVVRRSSIGPVAVEPSRVPGSGARPSQHAPGAAASDTPAASSLVQPTIPRAPAPPRLDGVHAPPGTSHSAVATQPIGTPVLDARHPPPGGAGPRTPAEPAPRPSHTDWEPAHRPSYTGVAAPQHGPATGSIAHPPAPAVHPHDEHAPHAAVRPSHTSLPPAPDARASYAPAGESMLPPTRPSVVPPGQSFAMPSSGNLTPVRTIADIMAMPLGGALSSQQVQASTLAAVLRMLLLAKASGTLRLEHNHEVLEIPVLAGKLHLTDSERSLLAHAFGWETGNFRYTQGVPDPGKRARIAVRSMLVEGVRTLMRGLSPEELAEGLGDRMHLSPRLLPGREFDLPRLALSPPEHRLIERFFSPLSSAEALSAQGGIGRRGTLQLLILLSLFEFVSWHPVEHGAVVSLAEQIGSLRRKLERANHFDILEVHWSSADKEIVDSMQRLRAKYGPGGEWDRAAPEDCKALRHMLEHAWEVLRSPDRRVAYRREVYSLDFDAISDLMDQRVRALSLRGAVDEATTMAQVGQELHQTAKYKSERPSEASVMEAIHEAERRASNRPPAPGAKPTKPPER